MFNIQTYFYSARVPPPSQFTAEGNSGIIILLNLFLKPLLHLLGEYHHAIAQ